jgi:yecA family protein
MAAPSLPEFDRTIQLSQGNLDAAELAECHGLLSGLLCRDGTATANDFLHHLAAAQLVVNPGDAFRQAMVELFEATARQLDDSELGYHLWLPEDNDPLEERTLALAQWCAGFLLGVASGGEINTLSEEAREAVEDLQQIARAQISDPDDVAESEEDEQAFAEIVEYVRIVALMMKEDLRGPGQDDPVH